MDRVLKNDRYHRFSAYNPTPGTGIVMGILTAYNANAALLVVDNPVNSPYWHVPEWLLLRVAAVDTGATDVRVDFRHDAIVRQIGGGSAITPVDHYVAKSRSSPAVIRFGAVTPGNAAAGEIRVAARLVEADAAPAFDVGDEWRFDFDKLRPGGIFIGREVIGPGESFLGHVFGTAMAAAPQLEFHYSYREVQKRSF